MADNGYRPTFDTSILDGAGSGQPAGRGMHANSCSAFSDSRGWASHRPSACLLARYTPQSCFTDSWGCPDAPQTTPGCLAAAHPPPRLLTFALLPSSCAGELLVYLIYVDMLGHDTSWAHAAVIQLCGNKSLVVKKVRRRRVWSASKP